jgi:hypothetical protein
VAVSEIEGMATDDVAVLAALAPAALLAAAVVVAATEAAPCVMYISRDHKL